MRSAIPSLKHHPQRAAPLQSGAIHWHGPIICIIASLFIAGLNTGLLQVWLAQAYSMDPTIEQVQPAVLEGLRSALTGEKKLVVRSIFRELTFKNASPPFDRYRQTDPGNGVYIYLQLLVRLRMPATAQAGNPDEVTMGLLRQLKTGPAACLYQSYQRELADTFLRSRGVPPRTSAMIADRLSQQEYHRPVLRELADRLSEVGARWRTNNHPKEALIAHGAVLRLFSDLITDSPTPDVVLLAAERLPVIIRELAEDAQAAGVDLSLDTEAAGQDVTRFVQDWHAQADKVNVSIIPWTGDAAMIPDHHDRVVRTFLAAALAAGTWLVLLLAVLLLAIIVLKTLRAGTMQQPFQPGGWGVWLAGLVVIVPLLVITVIVRNAPLSLTWLFSLTPDSVVAGLLVPLSVLLLLGPCTRLSFKAQSNATDVRIATRIIWLMSMLLIATAIAAWWLPVHTESWRPPINIQRLRKLGTLLTAECMIFLVVWFVWGQVRRRRSGWPRGVLAYANLQVASRSLLLMTLLSTATMAMNREEDIRHQTAFSKAAAEPIADRLGASWREAYFGPAEALRQRVEQF